jgi:hypothetical protein
MSSGGLTVPPAAALLAIYSALLLVAVFEAVRVAWPPLRLARVYVSIYLALRIFSFAVWLAYALGAAGVSAGLINASFSLFYAGYFLLVAASMPLLYAWLPAVAQAAPAFRAAPALTAARATRWMQLAAVVLMLAGGSNLLAASSTSSNWAEPVSIVGAALFLSICAVALPVIVGLALHALHAARAAALIDLRRAAYNRLAAAGAVLLFVYLCMSVRSAAAVATAAGTTIDQSTLYGEVIGPELPAVLVLLTPPAVALFLPAAPVPPVPGAAALPVDKADAPAPLPATVPVAYV